MARGETRSLFGDPEPEPEPERTTSTPRWPSGCAPRNLDEFVGQAHLVGAGTAGPPPDRGRRAAAFADPLGRAGHGQDDPGPAARRPVGARFVAALGGPLGRQGAPRGDRRGREARAGGAADGPLHRRDPPLQQGPAGRPAAGRRGRDRHPDRRDDREPLVRGQRRAAVARRGSLTLHPLTRGRHRDDPPPGAGRRRARAGRAPAGGRRRGSSTGSRGARRATPGWRSPRSRRPSGPPSPTRAASGGHRRDVAEALGRARFAYDKGGEDHYNLASALIKSVRNSDANAGALLAGPADRGRGRPALHRPAALHPGLRGRRPGRPPGDGPGGGRGADRPPDRPARGAVSRSPRRRSTWPAPPSRTPSSGPTTPRAARRRRDRPRAGPAPPPQRRHAADEAARLRPGISLRPRRSARPRGDAGAGPPDWKVESTSSVDASNHELATI